ncbi:MAG: hypothetical protein OEZ19_04025, partial [Paracoccaceae bacterium]|nr:hypothetical protein [Paracoccaceae bacterium]
DETLEPETEAIHILDENYDSDQGPVAGTEDEFPPTGAEAPPPVTKRRIGRPPKALEPGLDFQIKAPTDPLGISVPAKAAPAGAGATGPSAAAPIPQVSESEKDHSARAILWAAAGILLLVLALAIAAERFFFGGAVTNYLLQGALTEPASSVPFDEATPGDPGTPALARLVGGQRKISASEGLELSLPLGPDIATMPGTGVFTPILQSNDTALPVLSDAAPQPPPLAEGSVVASSRGLPGTEFEVPEEVAGSNWTDQQTTFASIAPDFSPFTDQAPTDEELAEGELDDPDNLPVVSLDDADRIYAATGIWVRSPAAPLDADLSDAMDMEQLYVASIDPPVTSQDAFAMPQERDMAPDISLPRFALPAQDGQVFELDASGLVALTPEGRLNQDGVMVYAGSPPLPGKARPEGLVPPELLGPDLEKLAQFRPRHRPGTLAESAERARLGGMSLTEMAAFRPKPRPASAQENISGGGTATVLAMARSAPPKPRPANFASIVQQTKAAEERRQQAAAAARVSVPTSANVADRATADRALRLGQLNLIGVFGSSSNRRALVRLPSGRFLKVQIGDNLDGGRVAAIDSSSLIYVKSGKSLRLEIPAG